MVRMGKITVGRTGFFKREYVDWINKPAADKTWVDFRRFWMNAYKSFDDMNKLTATESGFGANAMAEDGGTSGRDGDWDSAMDNLVAIMSRDKG